MSAPVIFQWDGEAMRPASPFMARLADRQFVIGERYPLIVQEERSQASHRHYFASIKEAWSNLPEHFAERLPSEEHLRRYALIKTGYCDSSTLVASSKAEAKRVAAFIRPTDEFQVVIVEECTVARYTAKSQSMKAMDKQTFQDSKDAVLEYISGLIGTDAATLRKAGEAA